ncbi:hypothetical protein [Amycolatopsis pigmentata]|uniref:Uncharacterized protein n=1 Tax=Amycolatopsis pigmentata TaxID=450801 RepID=A0ABW5G0N4_9PSEU
MGQGRRHGTGAATADDERGTIEKLVERSELDGADPAFAIGVGEHPRARIEVAGGTCLGHPVLPVPGLGDAGDLPADPIGHSREEPNGVMRNSERTRHEGPHRVVGIADHDVGPTGAGRREHGVRGGVEQDTPEHLARDLRSRCEDVGTATITLTGTTRRRGTLTRDAR